jgi:hypothetical protein
MVTFTMSPKELLYTARSSMWDTEGSRGMSIHVKAKAKKFKENDNRSP